MNTTSIAPVMAIPTDYDDDARVAATVSTTPNGRVKSTNNGENNLSTISFNSSCQMVIRSRYCTCPAVTIKYIIRSKGPIKSSPKTNMASDDNNMVSCESPQLNECSGEKYYSERPIIVRGTLNDIVSMIVSSTEIVDMPN